MSVTTLEGERVDPEVDWAGMPREEWDFDALIRCGFHRPQCGVDRGRRLAAGVDLPEMWRKGVRGRAS